MAVWTRSDGSRNGDGDSRDGSGDGNGHESCNHVHLFDRLKKLPETLFEEILLVARVDREHVSSPTAPLAMRALEVTRRAEHDRDLCRLLTRLLDERAPRNREMPPPGGSVHPGNTEGSAKVDERLTRMKREVAAMVEARARPFAELAARIACDPRVLPDRLVNLRGRDVAEHVLAVCDAQPSTLEGDKDRDALQSVLFIVLPYVSDWRAEVAACCAHAEGQAEWVALRYRSDTIAEAVMAGWMGRRCVFEHKSGAEPYGVGAVQIPATEQTALFTSEQHLLEGVVNQLRRQLGTGGLDLHEQRLEVEEELRLQGGRVGLQRLRYYFLFRDAASRDDPGVLWRLARTTLHGETGLPSLVLVRMQGRLNADEAALNRRIAAILKPRTPLQS